MKAKCLLAGLLLISSVAMAADFPLTIGTPIDREDGALIGLDDIAGYRMYYGTEVGDYQETYNDINAENPFPFQLSFVGATLPTTEVIAKDMPVGTTYAIFTIIDTDARESLPSNYITLVNDEKARIRTPAIPPGQVIRVITTTLESDGR